MKLNQSQESEIIKMKKDGLPLSEIKSKFNIKSSQTIYNVLNRIGKIRKIPNKKFTVNETFFDCIDTDEKSYWLGFLYADGFVRIHKNRSGQLRLKLKSDDKLHIEKFCNSLNSNSPIKDCVSKVVKNGNTYTSKSSYVDIYNTNLVKSLMSHGCVNNKTQKIRMPNLPEYLLGSFIRGYFDGDGCIMKLNDFNTYRVSLISNEKFINDIKEYLVKFLSFEEEKIKIYIYDNYSILFIYNYDYCLKFHKLIYDNPSIYLERKKQLFDNILIFRK